MMPILNDFLRRIKIKLPNDNYEKMDCPNETINAIYIRDFNCLRDK